MPTDRSLWVEDKYALRCRGCGEKFTMFRRRHHCRRCGQVFCYECLYNAQSGAAGQGSLIGNVYDWFSPSPTHTPHSSPDSTRLSSSAVLGASIAMDEELQAELSTRLCHRCAATIVENAEREASTSRIEFRPSSNSATSPMLHSSFSRAAPSPMSSPSLSYAATPLRPRTTAPLLDASANPVASASVLIAKSGSRQPLHGDASLSNATRDKAVAKERERKRKKALHTARHDESAEEREVTYSIGRVQRRVPATIAEWWGAHQLAKKDKEQRKLSTSGEHGGPLHEWSNAGTRVYVLTDPTRFTARFRAGGGGATPRSLRSEPEEAHVGSAASHENPQPTEAEAAFTDAYKTACTAHILSRVHNAARSALPCTAARHLSTHLAAIAWHVVQHTTVGLGACIDEHVALISVPCPSLPSQCVLYPGLICPHRLPSKREMTACDHPRVLLLAGHLAYPLQPAEDLVDYVRSYGGYLDKLFQRLVVWNPDVIVVEGGMHHYLRQRIEEHGHMRLLLHVGRDFLVRLSWCLQADIIADLQYVSMGDLTTTTPMGECALFEVVELAEEERFCAFSGFACVSFHTLVFRGSADLGAATPGAHSKNGKSRSNDRGAAQPPWGALEALAKASIMAAYHAALQWHWVTALLRCSAPGSVFAAAVASAVVAPVSAVNPSTACLTLNRGCRYPPEVLSACHGAGESISLVRDTLVVNVVLMDHLFDSGGGLKSALGVSAAASATALTTGRSPDFGADAALPGSHPASTGASRTDLAGLLSIGLGTSAMSQLTASRADSTVAAAATAGTHGYAVVQQKVALVFYGAGDDNLFTFLVSQCTSATSQLLYLHGGHRVRVTVMRAAPNVPVVASGSGGTSATPIAASGANSEEPAGSQLKSTAALEAAQTVALHLVGVRQSATRTFAPSETADAATTSACVSFLKGFFSLRITSDVVGHDTNTEAASKSPPEVDITVPLCSPHLLNVSVGAFLEWVFYGWMPALQTTSAPAVSPPPPLPPLPQRLRLVFNFHPDLTATVTGGAAATAVHRDTVTLIVDPVPIMRVRYPPTVLPSPPSIPFASHGEASAADVWYAAHDADELEATLRGFYLTLKAALDSAAPDAPPTRSPSDVQSGRLITQPPPTPAERSNTFFCQLRDRARLAVEALRESRVRGEAEAALFLRPLRQHLIPTLLMEYRAWQAEARRAASTKSTATPPAMGMPRESPDAAVVSGTADRGVLRNFEDCYCHPQRAQWIRLGEPSSVLAVALELLYGGDAVPSPPTPSSPVTSNDSRTFPPRGCAAESTGVTATAAASSPHVRFAVAPEVSPAANARSSVTSASSAARSSVVHDQQLLSAVSLTRLEAIDVLRQCGKGEMSQPASLICSLRGYKPVLPPGRLGGYGGSVGSTGSLGSGAASTVNALVEAGTTSASAIMGLGSGGGGSSGGSVSNAVNGNGGGGVEVNISVEVLFPHAFAALHVLYTNGAPLNFPAALLRCRPFMTDGGKSHARFFITEDGRFLVKCVKPMELRYFKEWASRYFARMADYYNPAASSTPSIFDAQSTLGKVLGLYVVHVQGSSSRSATLGTTSGGSPPPQQQQQQQQHSTLRNLLPDGAHCFMVAEQLLFQRPVRETWDLKGSQRNRTTEQTAAVRLDVDLVQERLRQGDFLFCTPEEKSLLMDHLSRDAQLLSDSGIMDYSLMTSVGCDVADQGSGNLYVGMIDFLHPYSSAKVLESKVKSGLDTVFGYGRRDPTIIDPASYAARFMLWMNGYFNGVPDRLFPLTRVRLLAERKENAEAETRAAASTR